MARAGRRSVLVGVIMVLVLAGSPGLWRQARSAADVGAIPTTWTDVDIVDGTTGAYQFIDRTGFPGAHCVNDVVAFPGSVDIIARTQSLIAMPDPNQEGQVIGLRANVFQRRPGGAIELVAQSDVLSRPTAGGTPATFPDLPLAGLPIGPVYLVQIEILWFGADGQQVVGWAHTPVDYLLTVIRRDSGQSEQPVDSACVSPDQPVVTGEPDRGIVNRRYEYQLVYFPINAKVNVRWDGDRLGTVATNDRGQAMSSFRIPAAPMGPHTIRWFTGTWTVSTTFTIAPRIKVIPGTVARGQTVNISLRGYVAHESVRIRWQNGSSWEEIARVTTSRTGSANIDVVVPDWVPDGANSVRGDSLIWGGGRAQTNAVDVLPAGSIQLSPARGTVNRRVTAALSNVPPHQPVTVTFPGFYEATVTGTTDDLGRAVLSFRVPASPIGLYEVEATGGTTATAVFEIAPRIKLIPGQAGRGETVNVSLRGFGAHETVRIRWKRDGGYEQIATVTTSGSGSANVDVAVPSWAPDGPTSVRGDGPIARAQTNAFVVAGGELVNAAIDATPTPSPTTPPVATPISETPTPTTEPTSTPDPTTEPTATSTPDATATPTGEPTATPEPSPLGTPVPADP